MKNTNNNLSWIKLYRKIKQWGWYSDCNTFSTFIHILIEASNEDKSWMGVVIKKGQLVTSLENLASTCGLSLQQLRTSLKKLISTHEITSQSNSHFTIITVINFESYQSINTPINRLATNQQHANNIRLTTSKEYKNIRIKEYKKIYTSIKDLDQETLQEIADNFQIRLDDVLKSKSQMIFWLESKGKIYKNYKAGLCNWILRNIDDGKIKKIKKPTEIIMPEAITMSPDQLAKNIQKLDEIRKSTSFLSNSQKIINSKSKICPTIQNN